MFVINTCSKLKKCLFLQHYVSSGMALEKVNSVNELPFQLHQFVHLTFIDKHVPGRNRSIPSAHHQRYVHTSCKCAGKNLLKKFFNKTKKKLWYETPPQAKPSSQVSGLMPPKKRGQDDNMRSRILNSILYKAVADLLSSPDVSSEVCNYSVEITRVSLSADFSSCRVYWKTSGVSELDNQIQQALDKSSSRIRYLIMAHQTLGGVPPLVFIKDKEYAAMSEIENLLKIADFGPEYEDEKDRHGEQLQVEEFEQATTLKKTVLFGVDHEALHKQIQEYKLRAKETVSQRPGLQSSDDSNDTPAPELTRLQLEVLAEYRKKKIMEKKKRSKRPIDVDITPKEYLLSRHSQDEEGKGGYEQEFSQEEAQIRELMAEENMKSS
ncbi:hypothetical protein UPYG_G00307620 [Umbra pygmaea]|uniref:Ribosome-binding factor A, mitochondrial n=1 Tax=Umbra pygmaea TaxID=75934 RepID=A0ABD0W3K3_UMBPY